MYNITQTMAGRPKVLTEEQIIKNRQLAQQAYRKNNKEKYNKIINTYNLKNREKIREQQNIRYRKKAELKKSPFYVKSLLNQPNEEQKKTLYRIAELISIGCIEKKSKGTNYYAITSKNVIMEILKNIGFTDEKDFWISRDWGHIPMKILKWNDINKFKINKKKMITYGYLVWILGLNKEISKKFVNLLH